MTLKNMLHSYIFTFFLIVLVLFIYSIYQSYFNNCIHSFLHHHSYFFKKCVYVCVYIMYEIKNNDFKYAYDYICLKCVS